MPPLPILEYGPWNAQFRFLLRDETDRSIDRSILRASTFVPLGFVSRVSYGEGKKEEERKEKEKGKKRGGIILPLPKSGLISNEGFSFSFSNRVTFDFCHVDAIDRNSRLNFLFAMSNDRETRR